MTYIMRNCDAGLDGGLTDEGREQAAQMGAWLAALIDEAAEICDHATDIMAVAMAEGWVTIRGRHVDIGDGAGELPTKAEIARMSHRGGNKAEQDIAERMEHHLSQALGMPKSPDNKPFDLQNKKVGIEVKTLVSNTNDKITMKADAVARKNAEVARAKLSRAYTVVVDARGEKLRYFVRAGYGSFRLKSMTEVADTEGLGKFMRIKQ